MPGPQPRIAVAAPNSDAASAARGVVLAGGNAVDAAIAATVVAMVTEPGVVSPMGGAFVAVGPPEGAPVVVDGNVAMPGIGAAPQRFGAGVREVTTTYGGGVTMHVGHGSVAVPGAFAALADAHSRYGAAPWHEVVAPAVAVSERGFRLGAAAGSYLAITGESVFGWDPQTRAAITGPNGAIAQTGELLRAPEQAATLRQIAERGAGDLYTGELAALLVEDMDRCGGLITAADLQQYRAQVRPALEVVAGDWMLATNPPPSIGGPVLAAMLRVLGPLGEHDHRDITQQVRAQLAVLGYRRDVLDVATDLKAAGRELMAVVEQRGWVGLPTSSSTAHVSAVDADGLACAITCSSGYGSGATVPGTGLMLNNCLGEPELNRHGLHALEPGTRLASNMAPTTGRSSDGSVLAIGGPGADRITTSLLQVLLPFCLSGATLQEAIDAPRLHVRVVDHPAVVQHEVDRDGAVEAAASLGLDHAEYPSHHMFFGGVGAALLGAGGGLQAAADPRRASATITA